MIFRYFTTIYFKIKMAADLHKKLFYPWLDLFTQNLFSVFWTPNQMVGGFINCMARSFQAHATYLTGKAPFPQAL
jgi:hypothetical protein